MSIFSKLFSKSERFEKTSDKKEFNLEKLLSDENKNNSIIEIDNFICELCDWGHNIDNLNKHQKNFFFNQNIEREVNNGGFNQFFLNSSGNYAHETIDSLKIVGAEKTANILQLAIDQFPDKKVPKNSTDRQKTVENILVVATEVWEELDQTFFDYNDNLNDLNIDYIKANKADFLV
jgi:hypothetical protein